MRLALAALLGFLAMHTAQAACGAGYFCSLLSVADDACCGCAGGSCTNCPPGTYADYFGNNAPCRQCPGGTYAATSGAVSCASCAAGTYSGSGAASCAAGALPLCSSAYPYTYALAALGASVPVATNPGSATYNDMQTCAITITAPVGAVLTVAFGAFSTESGYDFFLVRDGSPFFATPALLEASGATMPAPPAASYSNTLSLIFVSDSSVISSGVTAQVTAVCPANTYLTGSACVACAAGYTSSAGSTICLAANSCTAAAGYYCAGAGATLICPSGSYCTGGVRMPCYPATQCPVDGLSALPPCTWQVQSVAGSASAGFANGAGTSALFDNPSRIAIDSSGNFLVTDTFNNRLRIISPAGSVSVLAGSGNAAFVNGIGADASFNSPYGIFVRSRGDILVADSRNQAVRIVTTAGSVTTLVGTGQAGSANGYTATFSWPSGIVEDSRGNLFVQDQFNGLIRGITFDSFGNFPLVSTFVYDGGLAGACTGLGIDRRDYLYWVDMVDHVIRKATPSGVVSVVAGRKGVSGFLDGMGTSALLNGPRTVAVWGSSLVIAEYENNAIRVISPTGLVTTIAGSSQRGSTNGWGTAATFSNPHGLAVTAQGQLIVGESWKVRSVTCRAPCVAAAGSFCSTGTSTAQLCPADYYCPAGTTIPIICPMGTRSSAGASVCSTISCPAGQYLSGSVCYTCSAGRYSGGGSSASCSACSAGQWSASSSASCSACSAGTYSSASGSSFCSLCNAGTFSSSGASSCSACSAGSSSGLGASSCSLCSPGSFAASSSSSSCSPCGVGGYAASSGSSSCTPCPSGQTSSTGASSCFPVICPAGQYLSGSVCYTCGAGRYSGGGGSAFCSDCPAGQWSASGNASCTACAAGFYSGSGSALCTAGALPLCSSAYPYTYALAALGASVPVATNPGSATYDNSLTCGITITAPVGALISISFLAFSTEEGFDYFSVWENNSTAIRQLLKVSGSSLPVAQVSTSNTITLTFSSDISVTGSGVRALVSAIRASELSPFGLDSQQYAVRTIAGNGGSGYADGIGTSATLSGPRGLCMAASTLIVTETSGHRLRAVSSGNLVTTLAGSGSATWWDGTGTVASFNQPFRCAVSPSNGQVFVSDTLNMRIRSVSLSGVVGTFAGSGLSGSANGAGTSASFYGPIGFSFDASSNLYVLDANYGVLTVLRVVTPAGFVSTLSTPGTILGGFGAARGLALSSSGRIYIADTDNFRIVVLSASGALVNAYPLNSYAQDSAVDASGNVYLAMNWGCAIRRMGADGATTTIAGGACSTTDGTGTLAGFSEPYGLAIASSVLYVADPTSSVVRAVLLSQAVATATATATQNVVGSTSPTPSRSRTPTVTFSATATATLSAVGLPSSSSSLTPTCSRSPTATFTPPSTPTATLTPRPTPTASPTGTPTATPTSTPTTQPTPSPSPTPTATFTPAPTPTASPTASPTSTPSVTLTVSGTASLSPAPTFSPSSAPPAPPKTATLTLTGFPPSALNPDGTLTPATLSSLTTSLSAAIVPTCAACSARITSVTNANTGFLAYSAPRQLQYAGILIVVATLSAPGAASAGLAALAAALPTPAFAATLSGELASAGLPYLMVSGASVVSTQAATCPAGTFSSTGGALSCTFCPQGYYCPAVVNSTGLPCPAGTFGSIVGLATPECSGVCPIGYYCPSGTVYPFQCGPGTFGASLGLTSAACSGQCSRGHFCPAGSTSPTAKVCPAGRYGATQGLSNSACTGACSAGYWCPEGSVNTTSAACPPGTFGASLGLTSSACSGQCLAPYYCPAASTSATANLCPAGVYGDSAGLGSAACSGACSPGYYCLAGSLTSTANACPPGTFGIEAGLTSATCSGQCDTGYWCPAASVSARARPCPAGRYGNTLGLSTSACSGSASAGYFCPPASTSAQQAACPAGRYGTDLGLQSSACSGACAPGYCA